MAIVNGFIRGLSHLRADARGSAVTIGSFDGVHRGHQEIIAQVKQRAREAGLASVAIFLDPQPNEFFDPENAPARLMSRREKILALCDAGIDRVCCLQFNRHLRQFSAEAFIQRVLVAGLNARHLVIGDDFRFGCDRRGDFAMLQSVSRVYGFQVEDTRTFELDGDRVSSTRIRDCLDKADLVMAQRLLGKPYAMSGRVVKGQQLGRQLGAPTANLQLQRHRVPISGVFSVWVELPDGRVLPAVANVGLRPTVGDLLKPLLEVHLLDFQENLYGQRLNVVFLTRLRGEQRFDSLADLQAQIAADVRAARLYFAKQPLSPGQDSA